MTQRSDRPSRCLILPMNMSSVINLQLNEELELFSSSTLLYANDRDDLRRFLTNAKFLLGALMILRLCTSVHVCCHCGLKYYFIEKSIKYLLSFDLPFHFARQLHEKSSRISDHWFRTQRKPLPFSGTSNQSPCPEGKHHSFSLHHCLNSADENNGIILSLAYRSTSINVLFGLCR